MSLAAGLAAGLLSLGGRTCLLAEAPSVEHLFPAGFPLGSTNALTVAGKLEPWPPKVWVSCPGVTLTAETNKGRFQLEVAACAPPGPHLLRFYNEDGASVPRIFVITPGAELLETEPNDVFPSAQVVARLPETVNGRLDKTGDVDSFAVQLAAGQWLDARVDAYTLASKVDALLRLVTPEGVQLAWNHDGVTLDPRLSWQAPAHDTYVVQVMGFKYPADAEVRFTGGNGCVYRLHLSTAASPPEWPGGSDLLENEPNNAPAEGAGLSLPATLEGAIGCVGDEDCFAFTAEKDAIYEALVEAAALGSPLDAWLKLLDAGGKELARSDDGDRSFDPRLEWKAPTNGTFRVALGNTLHSGGPAHRYRLSLRQVHPDFIAAAPAGAILLAAGETNEVSIKVTRRRGFDRPLQAAFHSLPPGTRAEPVEVGKSADVSLKLIAAEDAPPAQLPVRIVIKDPASGEEQFVPFRLTSTSVDNGVPGGYTALLVESTDELWLTVRPKPTK